MAFVFSFRTIFIFSPILTFTFNVFIVNSILTFFWYCNYSIYTTNITYMIYNNFLLILTNSPFYFPSKLRSCFYAFQIIFLAFDSLHPTCILFFKHARFRLLVALWSFCLISRWGYVLKNFPLYFYAMAFKILPTISFNNFVFAY